MNNLANKKVFNLINRGKYLPLVFLVFYEVLPQLTCVANGDLPLFSNVIRYQISCNGFIENVLLVLSFVLFAWLSFKKIFQNFNIGTCENMGCILKLLMYISIAITYVAAFFTIINAYGVGERAVLHEIHQQYFANSATYTFVHLSIILSFVDYILRNSKTGSVLTTVIVIVVCLFTQSRSLILMAVLPYALVVDRKYIKYFLMPLVAAYFLRYFFSDKLYYFIELDLGRFIDMFGEFFNTWGGRRLMLDRFSDFSDLNYVVTSLLNITGIKYILYPLVKLLGHFGFHYYDHVEALNIKLHEVEGFTGVAGSFLGDFAFFPIASTIYCGCAVFALYILFRTEKQPIIKLAIIIYLIVFIHHMFRWSITNYLTSAVGIFLALKLLSIIIHKVKLRSLLNEKNIS